MSEAIKIVESIKGLRKAFATGNSKTYEWRIKQLQGVLKFMTENEKKIVHALSIDLGRHEFEVVGLEIVPVSMEIQHIIDNLRSWMRPTFTEVPSLMMPATSEITHEPFGVCLIMGAFNYPISLTLGPLIGAIAAGNCALIKPSEMSAQTEKLLAEVLPNYLDKDCFSFVCGGVSTTTELLKHQFDKIFFTGSPRVGKIVMRAAAEHLTPVSLELGGKSPTIVDETVTDMEVVAQRVLWGKCANAGQTCIAPDYLFVHASKYEAFLQAAKKKLTSFYGQDIQKAAEFARIVSTGELNTIFDLQLVVEHFS
jgi:acyl-CoA reductase-like NAD-dependent aldehyde dehydrogenase